MSTTSSMKGREVAKHLIAGGLPTSIVVHRNLDPSKRTVNVQDCTYLGDFWRFGSQNWAVALVGGWRFIMVDCQLERLQNFECVKRGPVVSRGSGG